MKKLFVRCKLKDLCDGVRILPIWNKELSGEITTGRQPGGIVHSVFPEIPVAMPPTFGASLVSS